MLPDQPPGVFAVGAGFLAEAGSISGIIKGKVLFRQNFIPVDIRHRDFRRGNQKIIRIVEFKQVLFEFRQLPCPGHALAVDQEGRKNLPVAMFGSVKVQHEIQQSPFQPGPQALIKSEPGSRDFCSPVEVQNIQRLANLPMRFGGEGEVRKLSPFAELRIVPLTLPDDDTLVGNVGNRQHKVLQGFLFFSQPGFQLFDPVRDLFHAGDLFPRIQLILFFLRDHFGNLVPLGPKGLGLLQDFPPLRIQPGKKAPVHGLAPSPYFFFYLLEMFACVFQFQHKTILGFPYNLK